MSKRKLNILVKNNVVTGWDDPRMPTLSGMRRRGYTAEAIKQFVASSGIVKRDTTSDMALLEYELRQDLNIKSNRAMAVLDPIKIIITNYPEEKVEYLDAVNNPEDKKSKIRQIPFSRELYIEKSDFMENPPKKYFRLSINTEVRLKDAFYITCHKVIKDENNEIKEIYCKYDENTKGGWSNDGRKVRGTIHWVSSAHCINADVHIYNRLFNEENPSQGKDFLESINPNSLQILKNCKLEPSLIDAQQGQNFQFIRHGYFVIDKKSTKDHLIFNQSVGLRDSWKKKLFNSHLL